MKKLILSFCTSLLIVSGCTYNQDKHIREILTKQTGPLDRLRDIWLVEQSLDHPTDVFSIELVPQDPLTTPKGTFPFTLLKGKNLPEGERLIFAKIDPVTKEIDVPFEFEILSSGQIQLIDKNGIRVEPEIPFIASEGLLTGKPIVYAVVAKKSLTIATAEFFPYPLEAKTESGASIQLEVIHPMLTRFELRAEGFASEEPIKIVHKSGAMQEEIEILSSKDGSFTLDLNPTILGKLGGSAEVSVIGKDQQVHLDYPWGAKLERKTFEERTQFPILFVVNQNQVDPEQIAFFSTLF